MKNIKHALFPITIIYVFFSCVNKNEQRIVDVDSKWPNVMLDTIPNVDFRIDSSSNYQEDEITVAYANEVNVKHRHIIIDSLKYYIVEGDILMDRYRYNQYRISLILNRKTEKANQFSISPNLRIDVLNSTPVRWTESDTITYCINRITFSSDERYQVAKQSIKAAAEDWMKTCNIQFEYKPEFDTHNFLHGNEFVDFVLLEFDAGGLFIAKAFFSKDIPRERNIMLDPSYYDSPFNKVGVLRHEIGHILGFRHEHISPEAPAACPDEVVSGTLPLTSYDPQSVMHYFCGGVGSKELRISRNDSIGATQIYGPSTFGTVAIK
ncbi:MAG: hypothetical protein KIT80_02995 [Chitinophagaceae bacterium]|nr:hypothetical protein [Chitinophagaceae bacterium]MCW5925852.1 hypothetical protein [Chitinophagaceae bacterium]